MDDRLVRIRDLIDLKDKTDAELETLIGGGDVKPKKTITCSHCNQSGHTARTCPDKPTE